MTATRILWEDATGQTYSISVDATISNTHAFNNTVTDHPVEKGVSLTDHVRPDPARVSLTGTVTNTPHYLPADHVGGADLQPELVEVSVGGFTRILPIVSATSAVQSILGAPAAPPQPAVLSRVDFSYAAAAQVQVFTLSFDRVREIFDELVRLRDTGTLCRVLTRLREYDNMVIEILTFPDDPGIGDALVFDVTFKEVRTVETRTVRVAAHKGTVSKKVVTPAEEVEADNTVLGWVTDGIGSLFQ